MDGQGARLGCCGCSLRSCHAGRFAWAPPWWEGTLRSAGRDGRWRLVRRPLGRQPWPGPARPTRRADGATPDSGSAGRERWPATFTRQPRPHGHRPTVRRPRPSPTRRRTQGDRHATPTHRRGQVAGSPDRGRAGDGDSNQLLAVPRGHRPHGGGRQRVEVTVLMTPSAVSRAEPGWPQPDRYLRWAAVLVVAHSAGALVAVGLPPLRLPWLGWRPQVGSTRSGSGLALPYRPAGRLPPAAGLSRGRHPGPSRPTWPQPTTARRRRRWLVELCSAPATPAAGGRPGPGPL